MDEIQVRSITDPTQRDAIRDLLGLEVPDGGTLGVFSTSAAIDSFAVQGALQSQVDSLSRTIQPDPSTIRDPLTGLLTHSYFQEAIRREVAEGRRYAGTFSLLVLNVDYFSQINRRYGYGVGDKVLQAVAQKVLESVRTSDLVSRFGGDEIAALLPKTESDGAWILAERIRDSVLGLGVTTADGTLVPTVISGGVAELRPDEDPEELETRALQALQRAKDAGRNRCFRAGDLQEPDPVVLSKGVQHRKEAFYDTVQALAAVVDAKDSYTHSHSRAVAEYAYRLAKKVGFEGERLETFRLAATLHDLGKIGVPDSILKKPGPLTDDEWVVMQKHPAIGRQIIGQTFHLGELVPAMYYHHERWDGRGYPEGLKAEDIPIEARIVTIADSYGAMVDDRPYRKGLGHDIACNILKKAAGLQFDPVLVEVFIKMIEEEELGNRPVTERV